MINVVLVEPEHPGNIGAVARVMKNFGFDKLVLINPKAELNGEAECRAKHGKDILAKALITDLSFLNKLDLCIATTARLGSEYNLPRAALNPEELVEKVRCEGDVGIVFGRESKGLTTQEIMMCDFSVSIPAADGYSTLNISHAVGIILYELHKAQKSKATKIANKEYKDAIMIQLSLLLDKLDFTTDEKKTTQLKAWKRIFGKSLMTEREAFCVFGLLKKLDEKLK